MQTSGDTLLSGNNIIYSLLLGFLITLVLIPVIVCIARRNNILYWPNRRTSHLLPTPALGGIAIFIGFIIPYIILSQNRLDTKIIIISSTSLIFFLGLIDDLHKIRPIKKLIIITLLAFVVANINDMSIQNLHGIFYINELSNFYSVSLTILVIVFIVNAINLLDGIDGLAGGMGIFILGVFSWLFYKYEGTVHLQMNFAMIASLLAFLLYNLWSHRYKIFMGDSGSLLVGLILSINLVKYFRIYDEVHYETLISPVSMLALFIVPVFDSVHVSIKRLLLNRSPFHPDRNHIHHTFLKLGFSHQSATLILLTYTLFFFLLSRILAYFISGTNVIAVIVVIALLFWHIPEMIIRRNPRKYALKRNKYKNGNNGVNGN